MYKFPLSIPIGRNLEITQAFKSTELVEYYKSKGINITSHEALDVACGNAMQTFGTPFVCPFPSATLDRMNEADAENGFGGLIQIKCGELTLGGIHLSGTVKQDIYKEGDILGYIGNYGYVLPEPTIGQPFNGSHIHLYCIVDGKAVNPLLYFDPNNPFRGQDGGVERDIFAIKWAIKKLREAIARLLG
jgi:hypothetical protein